MHLAPLSMAPEDTISDMPQYKAPQQLQGKPPDARTGVFACGLVFYGMWAEQNVSSAFRDDPVYCPPQCEGTPST